MFGFLIFAITFVTLLTLVVRLCQLRVRQELPETKSLGLTVGFVALLLAAWWFVTRGASVEQRILPPLILPYPMEVRQPFPVLSFEQGLVPTASLSFLRVAFG